jgi:hypothetical protein
MAVAISVNLSLNFMLALTNSENFALMSVFIADMLFAIRCWEVARSAQHCLSSAKVVDCSCVLACKSRIVASPEVAGEVADTGVTGGI